jgi:hypothetical protein
MKIAICVGIVAAALIVGRVDQLNAQSLHSRWATGFTDATSIGIGRIPELTCLGLPNSEYTETSIWDGWSRMTLDGKGRLHVAAKGTFSWALYPYADDIAGPFDLTHNRLYFGSTQIDFSEVIENYQLGSTWTFSLPSLQVTGLNGRFTLVARPTDSGSILVLSFAQMQLGTPNTPGTGLGAGGGQPVCSAQ